MYLLKKSSLMECHFQFMIFLTAVNGSPIKAFWNVCRILESQSCDRNPGSRNGEDNQVYTEPGGEGPQRKGQGSTVRGQQESQGLKRKISYSYAYK